jgi:hypothetical protein
MKSYKGGFVGSNSGRIEDCYSLLGLEGKRSGVNGFCGQNRGIIRQSFHSGRLGRMDAGFGMGGELENCFYFTGHGEARKADKLPDKELWREDDCIQSEEDAQELGFDGNIWRYTADKQVMAFDEDAWYTKPDALLPFPEGSPLEGTQHEKIIIDSADDLEHFASRVNEGDLAARNAEVVLTRNINLGGRGWTPIGLDKSLSFRGSFDGNGHRISNFRVNEKGLQYRGFFGVLEGGAYNLTVDCEVKGGGVVGTLAGQLLGGKIRCCGAVVTLRPAKNAETVGGLAGISNGLIPQSYAAGRMRFFPVLLLLALLALLLAGGVAGGIALFPSNKPVNAPVEQDPNQLEIPGADLPNLPDSTSGQGGTHSIAFSVSTEAMARLSTGDVTLTYQSTNPDADQKVVVQLRLSTGVVIAETGAIMPGNMITEMTLTDRAKAELTPGRYTAEIYMLPYSVGDESKGFTEISVPITLTVE